MNKQPKKERYTFTLSKATAETLNELSQSLNNSKSRIIEILVRDKEQSLINEQEKSKT